MPTLTCLFTIRIDGCTFHPDIRIYPKEDTLNPQSFFTHHYTYKIKLVIHTRQLIMVVSDYLLKDMLKVIKENLKN